MRVSPAQAVTYSGIFLERVNDWAHLYNSLFDGAKVSLGSYLIPPTHSLMLLGLTRADPTPSEPCTLNETLDLPHAPAGQSGHILGAGRFNHA